MAHKITCGLIGFKIEHLYKLAEMYVMLYKEQYPNNSNHVAYYNSATILDNIFKLRYGNMFYYKDRRLMYATSVHDSNPKPLTQEVLDSAKISEVTVVKELLDEGFKESTVRQLFTICNVLDC